MEKGFVSPYFKLFAYFAIIKAPANLHSAAQIG
jgi:hypothetical protein